MVAKRVLSEQVKEQVMNDILNGVLKPGERLVEASLAKKYGVSQAPVREALKSLEALHLVRIEPYKGTIVRKFTKKDIEEFFVVRSVLEGLAGRIAAKACTEADIDELEQILNAMAQAARDGNDDRRLDLNAKFHKRLIESSKNSLLIETAENLRLSSWSRVTGSHSRMDPEYIALRHRQFIDLLKARDEEGMERSMIRHVQQSLESFYMEDFPLGEED